MKLLTIFLLFIIITLAVTQTTKKPDCTHEALDPNPTDCGSFLQCVHGAYVVMPCPEGLYWNNVDKICDWPENTICTIRSTITSEFSSSTEETSTIESTTTDSSSSTEETSTFESSTTDSSSSTEETSTIESSTTNDPFTTNQQSCEHEALDPNPADCNSFLQCVDGEYVVMPCPSGLHWNNVDKICDWPENTLCPIGSTLN